MTTPSIAAPKNASSIFVKLISQVNFSVEGKGSFFELRRRVLLWAKQQEKIKGIPVKAWDGESFSIETYDSEPVEAIGLGRYWAFRTQLRDKDASTGRIWITEIGIGEENESRTKFGARLLCSKDAENTEPIPRSIPNFVRGIVFKQNAFLDGRHISANPWHISSEEEVTEFVNFLENKERQHPVTVFSLPDGSDNSDNTVFPVSLFIRRTAGFVHTAIISPEASAFLSTYIGRELSVFNQAVRTYYPGFNTEWSLPTEHPYVTANSIQAKREGGEFEIFLSTLIDRVLRPTQPRYILEKIQPPFQQVKILAKQTELARITGTTETDLKQRIQGLSEELDIQKKETEEALLLAADEEQQRKQQEAELAQYKSKYFALKSRLDATLAGQDDKEPPIPNDFTNLQEWADKYLSGQVYLHPKAVKVAQKSKFENVGLAYRALLLLRDYYIPMRIKGGAKLEKVFEEEMAKLGLENEPCLGGTSNAKNYSGDYYVKYDGERRELNFHLKGSNSRDGRYGFRLYYFWDKESSCVVVGYFPEHLPNSKT